jgi:hypothetical protein
MEKRFNPPSEKNIIIGIKLSELEINNQIATLYERTVK